MADDLQTDSYTKEISEIRIARSHEALSEIVKRFSSTSEVDGGILYSGKVGSAHSSEFIANYRGHTTLALIDDTPRGEFLTNADVANALELRARELFAEKGLSPEQSVKEGNSFLYGTAGSQIPGTSLEGCQWGRASEEFVASLKGDVLVIAADASPERTFAGVELNAALENPNITSIGGISTSELRERVDAAHGDLSGVLRDVQTQFRENVALGVFRSSDGSLVLSKEFAQKYHHTGDHQSARVLESQGLERLKLPELPPLERASPPLAPTQRAREPAETGPPRELTADLEAARSGTILRGLDHANVVLNVAQTGYDAGRVAQQYDALVTSGNAFAANAMLRKEVLEAGGGFAGAVAGSAAVGAGYGALAGSETGPGALITGAAGGLVGGVVGAIGGERIASAMTERAVDHQQGTDGTTYAYESGSWKQEHFLASDTPAPGSQIPRLDYERTTAVTNLAIANPPQPDPNRIERPDSKTGATRGWQRESDGSWQTHVAGPRGGRTLTETTASNPKLVAELNAASAQQAFIGAHGAQIAANAFVMDYYGKGWDSVGPLPQSVTSTLHLPSETQIVDHATGQVWQVAGDSATRTETIPAGRGVVTENLSASGAELSRVLAARDRAVAANHQYGATTIERNYGQMERDRSAHSQERQIPAPRNDREAVQSRVDALRAGGVSLPNVVEVRGYEPRRQDGTFVHLSSDTVAQHCGRGHYQLCDVARDLHGTVPPEGVLVSRSAQGQIREPGGLEQSRGHQR